MTRASVSAFVGGRTALPRPRPRRSTRRVLGGMAFSFIGISPNPLPLPAGLEGAATSRRACPDALPSPRLTAASTRAAPSQSQPTALCQVGGLPRFVRDPPAPDQGERALHHHQARRPTQAGDARARSAAGGVHRAHAAGADARALVPLTETARRAALLGADARTLRPRRHRPPAGLLCDQEPLGAHRRHPAAAAR